MEKIILTAAVTGAITIPTLSPHLPYRPEDIAADAIACAEAGASAVHVHARDPDTGRPSSDPELFGEIVTMIKEGCDAIIGITTGGGLGMMPEARLRPIPLYKPEIASFNLGSFNFSMHPIARRYKAEDYRFDWEQDYVEGTKDFIFRNTFGDMEMFATEMQKHGTRPEFEAYDVGHLHNLAFLAKSGSVRPPYWLQFVLGVLGALAATPDSLITMKQTADRVLGPENYTWSVIGVGYPAEFQMATMAIMMGGHVRVGLEDNIFVRRGELATNLQLVEKVVAIAELFEREIATPEEAREILSLKGKDAVNY